MQVLIRQISRRGKGGGAHRDRRIEAEEVRIGRSTDQDIQVADLRVSLEHARIRQAGGGRFELVAAGARGVRVNDRWVQGSRLSVGDRVDVGEVRICVIEPPEDCALALSVEPVGDALDSERKSPLPERAVLPGGPVSKRFWSWVLFLGVLGAFLVGPVAGTFNPQLRDFQRAAPLPGDHSWSAGQLITAHTYFEGDCGQCHRRPFVRVSDEACGSCHRDMPDHGISAERASPGARAEQCGHCHRDHNGADGMIPTDQRLCGDCHGGHALTELSIQGLSPAGDFGREHPQFRVSLVDFDGSEFPPVRRLAVDRPEAREAATLNFPHDAHLVPEGLDAPMGRVVLECGSCHEMESGGGLMAPIRMERHCQGCHRLELDPNYPQRAVPHGKPEEILYLVSEYFARLAVEGAYWTRGQPAVSFDSTAEAREWAHGQALQAAGRMFEDRACATCHQVDRFDTAEGPRWEVRPARLTYNWFPESRFSHQRHQAMECSACHAAETSSEADDVLMPGIETCRDCHGGQQARGDRIGSTCVTCHDFHTHARPAMNRVLGVDSGTLRTRGEEPQAAETETPRRRRPGQ